MFEDKQMLKAIVAEWIAKPGVEVDVHLIAVGRFDMIGYDEENLIALVESDYLDWWDIAERDRRTDSYGFAGYYKVRPTADGIYEALS